MKSIISIINEEINEFDFLGNNNRKKENDLLKTLNDFDFQKQFILDSIENPENIYLNSTKAKITGDWRDNQSNDLTVEYRTEVTYTYYKDEEIKFIISFIGEDISYNNTSDNRWFNNIDLKNISVGYYDTYGKKLRFKAYESAPDSIKNLFKRKYVGDLFK